MAQLVKANRVENIPVLSERLVICVAFFFSKFCQISTFYSILYLILPFTKEETEVRKQALSFGPARYIRTFDVISEVICGLPRKKRRLEINALYPHFEVKCVLPRTSYIFD